ncbi:hypothetical protein GDO86_003173, partial [Hymenochirus boettgeri]
PKPDGIRNPRARSVVTPQAGKLLINSRRKELNQPVGYSYGRWDKPPLVSKGWKHRLSLGDHFTVQRIQQQVPGPDTTRQFESLGLDKDLVTIVEAQGIVSPTWVQAQAIPHLLRGNNVICAAETGSGKTLAYLLPLVHGVKVNYKPTTHTRDPLGLVLVPSRELAIQIVSVARGLCAQLGLSVGFVGGGLGLGKVEKQLTKRPVDILVATPGALLKAIRKDYVNLTNLHYVVLDEADTLFDESFSKLVEDILMHIRIASSPSDIQDSENMAQLAVIGATFPSKIGQVLGKITKLESITTIKSNKLHYLMSHVQQTFKRVKGADKVSELLTLLKKKQSQVPGVGVLVFCNSSSTVNWLGYILEDHHIKHERLQGQMPAKMRMHVIDSFRKGKIEVLVCTDIASRGLDTCRVHTVVNYDFPPTLQDYIHRIGRVGRLGSEVPGSILSFVTHAWDVELVQKIETSVRKKTRLPSMGTNVTEIAPADLTEQSSETK